MKKLLITLALLIPIGVIAQTANVGIIQGIWFSADRYFVGDTIRVYTAVQNNTGTDVAGHVDFFDNNNLIGTKSFTALDNRIAEIWMDTVATEGKHQFSVKITELTKNIPGKEPQILTPRVIESEDIVVIDLDTDGDDIGNQDDDDDDNDGYDDKTERKADSDPLDPTSVPKQEDELSEIESTSSDAVVEKPSYVTKIEESYPELTKVTTPINRLQNIVVNRVDEARGDIAAKTGATPTNDEGTPSWVWQIYEFILGLIAWAFSCLVCTVILLFVGLYFVLRLLWFVFKKLFNRNT